jgi:cyclopropane-fatty-acyl-phospholipid synthase
MRARQPEHHVSSPAARGSSRRIIERAFAGVGVRVNGPDPWDMHIHDERFFDRLFQQGKLGLGESYMDGWWDCAALDELIVRLMKLRFKDFWNLDWRALANILRLRLINLQSITGSKEVAVSHYDLGNDFFARMLGPTMTYSCGYWRRADNLDDAQDAKHDLICDKLGLEPHHKLLDIGSGWGRLLSHAERTRGCRGVGVTISRPQWDYCRERWADQPVRFLLNDYRDSSIDAHGPFDRIVSVGMFEHVGPKNYRRFFSRVASLMAKDGLFLLHTIANRGHTGVDPWVDKYIFPNSLVPCVKDMAPGIDDFFVLEDWHNFGHDYDRTLMQWGHNFDAFANTPEFTLGSRFRRMWRYYLYTFAGAFRARNNFQLWQVVLSKHGTKGGYLSKR